MDDQDQELSQIVKTNATYHGAPPNLRARLRAAINAAPGTAVPPRPRAGFAPWGWPSGRAFSGPGAALVFGVVLSFGLVVGGGFGWQAMSSIRAGSHGAELTDEIVASHVRSLMASHISDVASTDQHTVKPWFNGKVDFSPPVTDFAAQGYPLTGGRLDYLGHRAVAALVYQRHAHPINLFLWPESGADDNGTIASEQGYHVMQWRHGGMHYAAVSDVNAGELKGFVDMVRQQTAQ